jgi:Tol biopolymer transport system component
MNARILCAAAAAALTGLAAPAAHATAPGANGQIVFDRNDGRQTDLFTILPDGTGLARLTRTPAWEEKAEWSADGRRIAFGSSTPSGSRSEIVSIAADGSDRRAVTSFGSVSAAPTWSPGGQLAFFTLRDFAPPAENEPPPPAELYSINADGTGPARLTHDTQIQTDPQWSPDGSTIAYSRWCAVRGQPGVFDLGVAAINIDGTNRRTLLPCLARRDIASFNWSPDGTRLVLEIAAARPSGRAPHTRQSDLAIVNADGSGLRRLTRTAALETNPVWSPNGQFIAFTSDRASRRRKQERNGKAFELYTMRTDGSGIQRLTFNHIPDLHPDWQRLPS